MVALVAVVGVGAYLYLRNRKKAVDSSDPLAGSKLAQAGNRLKTPKSSLVYAVAQQKQGTIAPEAMDVNVKTLGNRG